MSAFLAEAERFHTKRKSCETLPGCFFQAAGVGRSVTAAVLRLSPVLSHGLAMLGELVGGGGLRWMGTRGQGAGNGYSPGHQPLRRSGYPAGGNTHQARRESGEGQEVLKLK